MKLCITCRFYDEQSEGCRHSINRRTSPVDGSTLYDARWKYAISMRTATGTLDCGPDARHFAPRLEVA